MMGQHSGVRFWGGVAMIAAAAALGACNVVSLTAEATETWTRHYPLAQGGSLDIRNTNGRTEVLAGDGDAVDVTATKTARAMSDESARDALRRIEISETVGADRIAIDSSEHNVGFEINVSRRVDYLVHVPRWANVGLRATNGELRVRDLTGALRVSTTTARSTAKHSVEPPAPRQPMVGSPWTSPAWATATSCATRRTAPSA